MKASKVILFISSILFSHVAFAQLENKGSVQVSAGMAMFSAAKGENLGENVFLGYGASPTFGAKLRYNMNTNFSYGVGLSYMYASKPNYALSCGNLGVDLKYNFLSSDKKVSPFVSAEVGTTLLYLSRQQNSYQLTPSSGNNTSEVVTTSQVITEPTYKNTFSTYYASFGAGLDFTMKLKYGLFVSANYMLNNAASTSDVKVNFEQNQSSLKYLYFLVGVKFNFGRKKSMY